MANNHSFSSGGVDYITKPIRQQELFARVKTHVDLYRSKNTLKDYNKILEKSVLERTQELNEKNIKLHQEITERERSEKKFKSLFNDAMDMIHIVNQEGKIIEANPSELKTLGYSREEFINKNLIDIVDPDFVESSKNELQQVLLGKKVVNYETIYLSKEGKRVPVEVNTVPQVENGEVVSARSIIRNITERKKVEKQLRQAQKMEALGTLAGGVAHDFNNILSPILGYTEILKEELSEDRSASECLQQIHKASLRAKDLVQQILTFSRVSEQKLRPLEISLVIKEAVKLLRSSIPSSIEIRESINAGSNLVLADPTQIHQVVMNLCTNAYHAMRKTGGILSISLFNVELDAVDLEDKLKLEPGKFVVLRITDNGCGMTKETQSKIFDPYFTTKGKREGTGLGLAIVHSIITACNGDISVYSEDKEGTAFNIYLPFVKKTDQTKNSPYTHSLPTGTERIIMLDDEEAVLKIEKKMLEGLGYQVSTFTDCEVALENFKATPNDFDLFITDMTMPKCNGITMAKAFLSIRKDIPIMVCTGFSELLDDASHLKEIKKVIMKPVTRKEFADTVREVLDGD